MLKEEKEEEEEEESEEEEDDDDLNYWAEIIITSFFSWKRIKETEINIEGH